MSKKDPTRKMSDSELFNRMNQIFWSMSGVSRRKTCQYKSDDNSVFCEATSNRNCARCKFYTPTTQTKIRIIVREIMNLETENEILKKKLEATERLARAYELMIGGDDNSEENTGRDYGITGHESDGVGGRTWSDAGGYHTVHERREVSEEVYSGEDY